MNKNNNNTKSTILTLSGPYPLHLLGWKAFQDLCVGIAEECLRRPVQNFLPNNDAGRDGAFVGRWEGDSSSAGESTIQCKFTSRQGANLSLSMLADELEKASRLSNKGLVSDYIILTNHPITGKSELAIKTAFQSAGVGRCRVFGADWITRQIQSSPKLRMMAPRLYGLGNLHDLLDGRAYEQAQIILSAMGDDLQRLVITEAHKASVRAISQHNLVLLLGAPATGKSTIGAGIAVGAADIWRSNTIRATSPNDIKRHLDINGEQFFWIDDAWGNTQYQRQLSEDWNQLFPLMNAAMRNGTRFLITSRDYIWRAAKKDLKLSSLPILNKSQVIINVQDLSTSERAQILYNHIKLGDQPAEFKTKIKPFLPLLAERTDFLPETARRLGSSFFAGDLPPIDKNLTHFFDEPKDFLKETIAGLSSECRSAIAVLFLNGGKVRSPISVEDLSVGANVFGASISATRDQLHALDGSLLLLAQDEEGSFWTYKHPTVSDAFASYLSETPELVETYLLGANSYSIIYEVVCAGSKIEGAPLVIPNSLHKLLAERMEQVENIYLKTFLSYRSNSRFSSLMISQRPSLLDGMSSFFSPITNDSDATLLGTLHNQGVLPEKIRKQFVKAVQLALEEEADASFLEEPSLKAILKTNEINNILKTAKNEVLADLSKYVDQLKENWDPDYPPDDQFYQLEQSVRYICDALAPSGDNVTSIKELSEKISSAVSEMEEDYLEPSSTSAPVSSSTPQATSLVRLYRDVDE